jgi:hypothetical protein
MTAWRRPEILILAQETAGEIDRDNPYEKIQQFYDKMRYVTAVMKSTSSTFRLVRSAQKDETDATLDPDALIEKWLPSIQTHGLCKKFQRNF